MFLAKLGRVFTWIRLQHPEINDLEKPMDAALIERGLENRLAAVCPSVVGRRHVHQLLLFRAADGRRT